MVKRITLLLAFFAVSSLAMAQKDFVSYYEMGKFMQATPSSYRFGGLGYENPAVLSAMNGWEELSLFAHGGANVDYSFGGFSNSGPMGFGTIYHNYGDKSFWDTRVSLGMGNRTFGLGVSYSAIGGDKEFFGLSDSWTFGLMYRPIEFISFGYHYRMAYQNETGENIAELAIRPIPNYPLAVFADAALMNGADAEDINWSAGISWEVVNGIRINARYFDTEALAIGLDVSLGKVGMSYQANATNDDKMELGTSTYAIRFSQHKDRTLFDGMGVDKRFKHVILGISKKDEVLSLFSDFSLSSLFGGSKLKLSQIMKKMDKLKADKSVHSVYLNISDFTLGYEELWEVREKIKELQAEGIKIIIFAENLDMSTYHFASVADDIYLDPLGNVMLQGYAMGRSYYKDMLDKFGVGFEEIRLYKYKSAAESFARNTQSEGDREQRQKYIDDVYAFAKQEIAEGRDLPEKTINDISNTKLFLGAKEAEKLELIDKVGRWRNIDSILAAQKAVKVEKAHWLVDDVVAMDNVWSEKKSNEIAIVYASGACDMESGIKARKLADIMESVCSQSNIKAVILRVDSPGGSAMASDLVAEVVRKYKGKKPIIVSQASLAASGGYWLSMDADTIVAAPMTITGSIGVIAQWIYDKGLSDTLGINYEVVKAGTYSDLGQPFTLPFIGLGLPARNLTTDERGQFESMIDDSYHLFVKSVADGRGMDSAKVHDLAQGRIYSGLHGKEVGLVDVIGGLQTAINIAKDRLKLADDEEIKIREYAPAAGFSLPGIFSSFSYDMTNKTVEDIIKEQLLEDLKMRIDNNGKPMLILPPEYYEHQIFDKK